MEIEFLQVPWLISWYSLSKGYRHTLFPIEPSNPKRFLIRPGYRHLLIWDNGELGNGIKVSFYFKVLRDKIHIEDLYVSKSWRAHYIGSSPVLLFKEKLIKPDIDRKEKV